MKNIVILMLFLIPIGLLGQSIKIKNFIVTVDGKELCKVKKDAGVKGSYYFVDLNDKELIYVKWNEAYETAYFEVLNAKNLDTIIFEYPNTTRKSLIKKLYLAGVITFEGFNEDELVKYGKKVGKPYTEKRDSLKHY
ncbi:MAG: hypothetical protein GQ574_18375 [Crocinitomix sp.]|nr:hypothetical protein [Crocinitomix sp.]